MARGPRGHHPGFTILELLFTIAIAGTLTTIAVPQGLRALDDFHARSAARYLAQRLAEARITAVRRSAATLSTIRRASCSRSASGKASADSVISFALMAEL